METVIILVLSALALGLWCDNYRLRKCANLDEAKQLVLQNSIDRMRKDWENEKEAAFTRGRNSVRIPDPQPAGDKIQDRISPRTAYVPIARRRAAAEVASQAPATHDARVRENNARAMETAG